MKHIHDSKIIHWDIKLDNVLLDENLDCKICDFGVSWYMNEKEMIFEKCGTPAYLAPEVLNE